MGRVVFDGAALAGKTTNLQRITELVPNERRTEMFTPGSLRGRTMFFDWLEIDGPRGSGPIGLKFQLITVPGQVERNHRRRPLVMMADTVVFVFDSSPEGVPRSMDAWRRLRRVLRARAEPLPLLVQANKQDVSGACPPSEVASLLGLDVAAIVPATCATGGGVQKTITSALKLVHGAVKRGIATGSLSHVSAADADADALFFTMLEREDQGEIDPEIDDDAAGDYQAPRETESGRKSADFFR